MNFDRSAVSLRLYTEKFPLIMQQNLQAVEPQFFLYMSLSKTCDLQGRAIFGPQGHNLNKLEKGSLDDATYIHVILRLYALWFQTRTLYKPLYNI